MASKVAHKAEETAHKIMHGAKDLVEKVEHRGSHDTKPTKEG
jgi:hypothetical protein